MTDAIYDVVRMFPDVAEYVKEHETAVRETIQPDAITVQVDPARFDRTRFPRFRRKAFKDLIDILLLTELLRRRRR